jgi:hypothetical protein
VIQQARGLMDALLLTVTTRPSGATAMKSSGFATARDLLTEVTDCEIIAGLSPIR